MCYNLNKKRKKMIRKISYNLSLVVTLSTSLFADMSIEIGKRFQSQLDTMTKYHVDDTKNIEQDVTQFVSQATLFTPEEQEQYQHIFKQRFFEPWHIYEMGLSSKDKYWQFKYAKQETYKKEGEKISASWYQEYIEKSNFGAYDTLRTPAITIAHTDLKLFPTEEEIYYDPSKSGQGFPFDYNQNSAVYLHTPLFVSHYSLDGEWIFVKTAFANGWVKKKDIAFVDDEFKTKFENNKYAVTTKDNLNLKDDGQIISIIKMGTIFPMNGTSKLLITKKNAKGYGELKNVKIRDDDIVAYHPYDFTRENIIKIGNQLINEPYGWGGKLQARDCSALTRDFFAPFGVYLSRNSSQQSRDGKSFISLKGLTAQEKKDMIVQYAKPFRSILFVPGHIVLYVGVKNGEPIIMHNYWGVRKCNGDKCVIGRSIISTTEPGREMIDVKTESMLSNTLQAIVNF